MRQLLFFSLMALVLAVALPAQSLEDARMARGDDPRWADPAFDDRDWETVRNRRIRPMEDAKENRLWLRIRVTVPAGEPAAVAVIRCPCEVFLDSIRLGATGDLNAPRPKTTNDLTVFPVPAALAGRSVVLAARLYHPPGREALSGPISGTVIRLLPVRYVGQVATQIGGEYEIPFVIRSICLLLALGGLLTASLGQRRDPLILGMLGFVFSQLATGILVIAQPMNAADNTAWIWVTAIPVHPMLVIVQWQLARLPIQRNWCAVLLAGFLVLRTPWAAGMFLAKPAPWMSLAVSVVLVPHFAALGMVTYTAVRGWPRSSRPVRFLLLAVVTTLAISVMARLAGQGLIQGVTNRLDAGMSLVFTVFATAYIIRTGRERRAEQERLRSEMESAQTVQALLLNQAIPAEVEAVYLPASEVGGDFYQAFATPAGTLLVVGDVSGKGLQAAMRVSTIVGALRNRRSDEPAAVLAELNAVLAGSPGFTTCCCALFPPDGGPARVANAGHPAPYVDGAEVESDPALPLGVVPGAAYVEQAVPGSVYTFVSDGVVEAAAASGELFGFERTRSLSTQSAQEIAEAAKAWGQNDDITAVTVRRNA